MEEKKWYVLRDLKRPNSNSPAYKVLPELGIEVFTPMHWVLRDSVGGRKTRLYLPVISGLLFAHACRMALDPIVGRTDTLQYRYLKGAPQNTPMTVPAADMERFIAAVADSPTCRFFAPEEITPDLIGRDVIIRGGTLDGYVGKLLKLRGARKPRMLVSLPGLLTAAVEINPDFLQL